MVLEGTDPVTDIPGVGPGTADRLPDGLDTVRDFVLHTYRIDRLPSKKDEAAHAIRTAEIEPFNGISEDQISLAKLVATTDARLYDDSFSKLPTTDRQTPGANPAYDAAVAAAPYPCWIFLGRFEATDLLPPDDDLTTSPTSVEAAHYRHPTTGRHHAVYHLTTADTITAVNNRVTNPADGETETVVSAHALDVVADIFGRAVPELQDGMRFEQDSPVCVANPETGFTAMIPAATCPARLEAASTWPQATRTNAADPFHVLTP